MADSVVIKITGDDSDFRSKMSNLGSIAKKGAAAVGAAFVAAGTYGVKLASDLQEVQNVVEVTFGEKGTKSINKWAKAAAEAYGLSELEAKKYTGTMGAMLKSMGMTDSEVLNMSESMVGLTGDFASFYNLDSETAFEKIRAGISGETEPLKQLGINMSVANLEAFALSQGIDKSYNSMTQAEQATLRYNYLMSVSADAQGDFARTSESFANQMRITKLEVSSMAAELGTILLPIVTSAVKKFTEFIKSIDLDKAKQSVIGFINTIKTLTPVILSVAAATAAWRTGLFLSSAISAATKSINIITGVMAMYTNGAKVSTVMTTGFSTAQKFMGTVVALATGKIKLAEVAQWAWNAAISANPIGLIIIAIVALVAIIVVLWNKCEWFRDLITTAFEWISTKFAAMWEKIKAIWDTVYPYLVAFWEAVKPVVFAALDAIVAIFSAAWAAIKFVWDLVQPYFQALWDGIVLVFSVAVEVFSTIFSKAFAAIKFIWDLVAPYFQAIWRTIEMIFSVVAAVLGGDFGGAVTAIKFWWNDMTGYFSRIWEGIKSVFSGVVDFFRNLFSDAYDTVKEFFTVENFTEVFKESICGGLENIIEDVKTSAGKVWKAIKEAMSKAIDVVFGFSFGGGDDSGVSGSLSPFNSGRISSPYGAKRKGGKVHTGIDFAAPRGTPIQSTTNGRVVTVANLGNKSYGQYVVVQDAQGFKHYYAHMSRQRAFVGMPVGRGTTIGYVGTTGNSTGNHLHYEVRKPGGGHTNPAPWWKGARGYATGGFPSLGEMFVANESGIELMGKMGSKNVVANNMQIVEGIKQGLFSGMANYARAKGASVGKVTNITQEMHFHKENESPSDIKRAARKGVKLGLAGGIV